MEIKTLVERLEELPEEFGMPMQHLSLEVGLGMGSLSRMKNRLRRRQDIQFSRINKIAKSLDLIAVVFYKDECVVDLGHPGFLYGEEVYEYVGEVFIKYRNLLKRTQIEIGEQIGIKHNKLSRYENGVLPKLHRFQIISDALGLVPDYLVQKKQESPTIIVSP